MPSLELKKGRVSRSVVVNFNFQEPPIAQRKSIRASYWEVMHGFNICCNWENRENVLCLVRRSSRIRLQNA